MTQGNSASSTVSVDIVAQIAGFKTALAEATKYTGEFATGVKEHIERLNAPFEHFNGLLASIGVIAAGAGFKEIIDDTVKTAIETNKLAMAFGTGLNSASVLGTELKTLGINSEEYTQAAMKLDRQVRTNAETLERHGLVIKDSNGRLLDQQTLMQNAVAWLASFKEGTDRNIAAQVAFGRGVGDVNQMMRLTAEAAARAKKDVADLGLGITNEDVQHALDYKVAISQLGLTFEGIKKAIGDAVLPYLTKFSQWFRDQGPTIISGMKETVKTVIEFAFDVAAGFVNFATSVANGLYNIFVLGQYIRTKLGYTTQADAMASIDQFEAAIKRLDGIRSAALSGLANIKNKIIGGEESEGGDKPVGLTGTRSAEGLGKGGDAKADEIAKLREERIKMINDFELQKEIEKDQQLLDMGKITNLQFLQDKLAIAERMGEVDQQSLTKARDIYGQSTVEWEKAENARVKASEKSEAEIAKLRHQTVMQEQKDWNSVLQPVLSSWNSQLRGLLAGTETFSQAMKNVFADMVIKIIEKLEEIIVKEVIVKALEVAIGGPTALIPIPGFASGSDFVPQTGLALVHQGERIISAADNAAGAGAGAGAAPSLTVNISSMGPRDVRDALMSNQGGLRDALMSLARNGGIPGLRPA